MEKEPLLPNLLVGWVGYGSALDVFQKRKLPYPYQESSPLLSCP